MFDKIMEKLLSKRTPDVDAPRQGWTPPAWLDVLSRSGTPLFVSARPGTLTEMQEKQVMEAFVRASVNTTPAEPLDWQDTTAPRLWKCADGTHEYDFDRLPDKYEGGEYWR